MYFIFQTLKTKQRMLKEDWEFFKQRRFIEEQVRNINKQPSRQITTCSSVLHSSSLCCWCCLCSYRTAKSPPLETTTSQKLWGCSHLGWVFQTVQTAITEDGMFPRFSCVLLSALGSSHYLRHGKLKIPVRQPSQHTFYCYDKISPWHFSWWMKLW